MTAKIPSNLILEDIRRVIAETGSTKFKDYKSKGKYSECAVTRVIGSWTKFLKSEGYVNTYHRSVSKKEFVDDVKSVFAKTGNTKQENYIRNGKFSRAVVKRLFGSWNKMLCELGYQVNMLKPGQYTKEGILENYKKLKKDFGRPLNAAEFRKYGKYSQPIIDRVFGSFTNMKRELGELVDGRFVSNEELEKDIRQLYEKYGVLSEEIISQEAILSYPTILARYGTLNNLCSKLKIPQEPLKNKSKFLIKCLTTIKEHLGNEYVTEKTFPWLRNPVTNRPMFIDIFYPKLKLAIEVDGEQHHEICMYTPTQDALKRIQQRDKAKDNLLLENGYKVIRLNKSSSSYIEKKLKDVI